MALDDKTPPSGPTAWVVRLGLVCVIALAAAYLVGLLPGGTGWWSSAPIPGEVAKERQYLLDIRDGKVPDDLRLIRVSRGDRVTLKWTADRPMLLHLHGYDIEVEVRPGAPAEFAFTAHAAGRFSIEAHAQGGRPPLDEPPLLYLEVYPR